MICFPGSVFCGGGRLPRKVGNWTLVFPPPSNEEEEEEDGDACGVGVGEDDDGGWRFYCFYIDFTTKMVAIYS